MGSFALPARADRASRAGPSVPAARQHFVHGNRLYRVQKFDEAIAQYQAAAVIEPAPIFDFNLGQCYRKLGRYADALWHYERFLRNSRPNDELRVLVTDFVRKMRDELGRVRAADTSATVTRPERTAMTRPPVDVAVVPRAPDEARAGSPSDASSRASDAAGGRAIGPWHADSLGWTLLGAGVLGAGGAGVLLASASGRWDDAMTTQDEARRAELHAGASTRARAATVLGSGGAALLAAGVIKLVIHAGEQPRPRTGAWRFRGIGLSQHGVVVLGRF
ncbi:MAG TPA: tetratricopeptide repeat protein [Kofleriaceae bacterium]|nr:tetratricopeptide repeat protein [Kofleriaceae bacterium]